MNTPDNGRRRSGVITAGVVAASLAGTLGVGALVHAATRDHDLHDHRIELHLDRHRRVQLRRNLVDRRLGRLRQLAGHDAGVLT